MAEFTHTCPYCNQELLLEDDWAGQAIVCPKCNNSIKVPDRNYAPQTVAAYSAHERNIRFSSAYSIDKAYKLALDGFCVCSIISIIVPLVLFIIAFITLADDALTGGGIALLSAILSIPFAILGIWAIKFTTDLKKPYKKITCSSKNDTLLIIYGILNGAVCIVLVIALAVDLLRGGRGIIRKLLGIIFLASAAFSVIRVRAFYKLRAEEDAGFTEEEIAAGKDDFLQNGDTSGVSITQQLASGLSLGCLVPFAGLIFLLPAVLFAVISTKKGFPVPRAIICMILGAVINIVTLIIAAS